MKQLYDNDKKIESIICGEGQGEYGFYVGAFDVQHRIVKEIICYKEAGECGYIPWFLIVNEKGKEISRINGKYVVVVNFEE